MTSPTDKPKPSLRDRLSGSSSSRSTRRVNDPDARFTRNVTLAFVLLIAAAIVIVLIAFVYGFWEANLKPLANVNGTEIGRGTWEDRQRLEQFRAERSGTTTRAALLAGEIDEELANRRLTESANVLNAAPSAAMETLVTLTHQQQLAEERGITLGEDELAAALAADGTFPEMRRIAALVIQPTGGATGQATAQDHADARARAEEARAKLESGTPLAELVDEYSPATAEQDGDIGYGSLQDLQSIDPVWAEKLFALDEGGITEIVESESGDQLIGVVTTIVPEQPDAGFLTAVNEQVGEAVHRRNVELEATAKKLEEAITAEAVEGDVDQVRLAEILVAGDTLADPETDEGSIRASHILYTPASASAEASASPGTSAAPSPGASTEASLAPGATAETSPGPVATAEASPAAVGTAAPALAATAAPSPEPTAVPATSEPSAQPSLAAPAGAASPEAPIIPESTAGTAASAEASPDATASPDAAASPAASASPGASLSPEEEAAWDAASDKAAATAAEMRAITDVTARMAAFAERARQDGTDATAEAGGDLGFFERADMVPEFADALFDAEGLQQGDIVGPVRSEFGWHVILFDERRAPLADRLATVEEALAAPDADFAAVAREYSDGPTAEQGGEIGWQILDRLEDLTKMAVTVLDIGEHSQAIDGERGYTFYEKLEEATRPMDADEAARIAPSAFSEWYDEERFQAEDAGTITIDDSVRDEAEA